MVLRVRRVLAAAVLVAACGGRYSHIEDDGEGSGATATSGGSSQAGKGPKGGKASAGGSSPAGGAINVAGTVAVGGVGTAGTGPCACPDVDCRPGTKPSMQPGSCCPVCTPIDCSGVMCPGIACDSGSELVYPPDACCPICAASADCDVQRRGYFEFRTQVLEKYGSLGCMRDADCTYFYEGNACSSGCGTPFPAAYVKDAMSALDSYAKMACFNCFPQPVPPCDAPAPAACVNGRCSTLPYR